MYLIFDIETTGLIKCEKFNVYPNFKDNERYNAARIVQIAWVVLDNAFQVIDQKNYIIKKDNFNIPNANFHGITDKKSCIEGTKFYIAMLDFYEALKISHVIIAHNILFDYNVLLNHLYRHDLGQIFAEFSIKQKFCTSYESTNMLKLPMTFPTHYYKYPSLQELYTFYFNKKIPNAHDASADVDACAKCFVQLIQDRRHNYSNDQCYFL